PPDAGAVASEKFGRRVAVAGAHAHDEVFERFLADGGGGARWAAGEGGRARSVISALKRWRLTRFFAHSTAPAIALYLEGGRVVDTAAETSGAGHRKERVAHVGICRNGLFELTGVFLPAFGAERRRGAA